MTFYGELIYACIRCLELRLQVEKSCSPNNWVKKIAGGQQNDPIVLPIFVNCYYRKTRRYLISVYTPPKLQTFSSLLFTITHNRKIILQAVSRP